MDTKKVFAASIALAASLVVASSLSADYSVPKKKKDPPPQNCREVCKTWKECKMVEVGKKTVCMPSEPPACIETSVMEQVCEEKTKCEKVCG